MCRVLRHKKYYPSFANVRRPEVHWFLKVHVHVSPVVNQLCSSLANLSFPFPQALKHPVMLPGSSLKAHLSFLCLCSWNVAVVWYGMEPVSAPGMWQWCLLAQNLSGLLECGNGVIWHRTCLLLECGRGVVWHRMCLCSWSVAVVSSGTEPVSAPGM